MGIDGGQSSTVGLIADETGRVLGMGRGGPCNHAAAGEGRQRFVAAMRECLNGACLQSGLDASSVSFEAVALGFSGGIEDKDTYSREFFRSKRLLISNDAEIALAGATSGQPGIIVIAGTGSIAFGRNRSGRTARAGGWGYIFGDEGAAFDLVRQALRTALAMEEGWGPGTQLHSELLKETGAESANALMHDWYNRFDRKTIARLAPLVDQTAQKGDPVALEILKKAAIDLVQLVGRTHKLLFSPNDRLIVSYVGGVFTSQILKAALKSQVRELLGRELSAPVYPPVAGALLIALQSAGCEVTLSNVPAVKT